MMQDSHTYPEISFVIRLWLERRSVPGLPEWRFQVRHVQSGEQIYCRHLQDLLDFVERQASIPGVRLSIIAGQEAEEVQP